jgi:hypothetical protein
MGDRRKCQTYAASPAEPGGLPVMLGRLVLKFSAVLLMPAGEPMPSIRSDRTPAAASNRPPIVRKRGPGAERNDFRAGGRDIGRPGCHEFAVSQTDRPFGRPVGRLGLVLDHMGGRGLPDLAGKIGAFRGPVGIRRIDINSAMFRLSLERPGKTKLLPAESTLAWLKRSHRGARGTRWSLPAFMRAPRMVHAAC